MSIIAFNWGGYRLLSHFMEHRSDLALESKIDREQYDENSLIELRVPMNAPYLATNSTAFERVEGEIEIEGTHYRYVKRKVENGELVLLCIPNEHKKKIQNSRVDFFKLVNDLNQSAEGKSKNTTSYKSFVTEYRQEANTWSIPAFYHLIDSRPSSFATFVDDGYHFIPDQPPQV